MIPRVRLLLIPALALLLAGCVAETVRKAKPRKGTIKEIGYVDLGGGEVRYSLDGWGWFVGGRRRAARALMRRVCGKLKPVVTEEFEREDADVPYSQDDIAATMARGAEHFTVARYMHMAFDCAFSSTAPVRGEPPRGLPPPPRPPSGEENASPPGTARPGAPPATVEVAVSSAPAVPVVAVSSAPAPAVQFSSAPARHHCIVFRGGASRRAVAGRGLEPLPVELEPDPGAGVQHGGACRCEHESRLFGGQKAMITLRKPVVFFDLETTGVAPDRDRIVDLAFLRRAPDGQEEVFSALVDPGMPIPPEATAVHHITDEMVRGQPSFPALAPKLLDFIGDADLAGFGILRFDVPMLTAEFQRAGVTFTTASRSLVDALTVFHRMEPRNLTAAYKLYCGKALEDAHRAEADMRASSDVLWAQLERYPELPKDMAGLAAFCAEQRDSAAVDGQVVEAFVLLHREDLAGFGAKQPHHPLEHAIQQGLELHR